MNIRKLEDLSKEELIELIKHERETCGQLKPISVEEQLPLVTGETAPWSVDVLVYTSFNENFIACYDYELLEWFDSGDLIADVTHWLPIPRLPI